MTPRTLAPTVVYIAAVTAIAALGWLTAWPIHSPAVSISSGVTAGWLAGMFLPCPCHHRRRR